MEADGAGSVYRVSHVVDGESVDLLRQKHSRHYDFATRPIVLTVIGAAREFDRSIFKRNPPGGFRLPFD